MEEKMALLESNTRSTLVGVGIGAGAMIVLRYAIPVVAAVARPFCKAVITASMDGFERASHQLAVAAEAFQDLVAEARAERTLDPAAGPGAAVMSSGSREVN
jgi:hypothetical protein